MKKYILILVVLIGFGISANAQLCQLTDGVTPKFSHQNDGKTEKSVSIDFTNANDYKVSVTYVVTYKEKEVSGEQYLTLVANAVSYLDKGNHNNGFGFFKVSHWAGGEANFNKDYLGIKIKKAVKCN